MSGDLIMNIPGTSHAVKSASTNPSSCQLLLYYMSTITGGFHYTSPSAKPSTTGSVQVVCASSQLDAYLTTHPERKFTSDYLWMGHWGNSCVEVQGTAPTNHLLLLVPRGGPAQQFSLSYRDHNFQIFHNSVCCLK